MNDDDTTRKPDRNAGASIVAGALAALSSHYLLNPGFGIFDLIPDNLPVIGNLDETAAAALLISCLAYFGFDPGGLVQRILRLLGLIKHAGGPAKTTKPATIDVETR